MSTPLRRDSRKPYFDCWTIGAVASSVSPISPPSAKIGMVVADGSRCEPGVTAFIAQLECQTLFGQFQACLIEAAFQIPRGALQFRKRFRAFRG